MNEAELQVNFVERIRGVALPERNVRAKRLDLRFLVGHGGVRYGR